MNRDIVMRYVENARSNYFNEYDKPERYRDDQKLSKYESCLIQIENLAIELGYITTGTI